MELSENQFSENNLNFLLGFLEDSAGIVLQRDQVYLLNNRLTPLLKKHEFQSLNYLVDGLKKGQEGVAKSVVEALTTHETFFFRDKKVFDYFVQTIFPQIKAKVSGAVNIWTAACSSGQEPYSLLMALKESGYNLQNDVRILGTDLSTQVLAKAKQGIFTHFEAQRGLPAALLIKYFDKVGGNWQIKEDIRGQVTFKEHNLLGQTKVLGAYECIFCRNVLIYFSPESVRKVLESLHESLQSKGYLILGGAELILQNQPWFNAVKDAPGVYQRAS